MLFASAMPFLLGRIERELLKRNVRNSVATVYSQRFVE